MIANLLQFGVGKTGMTGEGEPSHIVGLVVEIQIPLGPEQAKEISEALATATDIKVVSSVKLDGGGKP